jgi:hypothetical protein
MFPTLKSALTAGSLLLGGLAGLAFIAPVGVMAQRPASSRFIYGPGSQGFGYYSNSGPQATPTSSRATGVGGSRPRNRDWSTGQRLRNHKPWLRPMD